MAHLRQQIEHLHEGVTCVKRRHVVLGATRVGAVSRALHGALRGVGRLQRVHAGGADALSPILVDDRKNEINLVYA